MPATNRQQQIDDRKFRDAAILLAFEQCLREFGVKGAIGCTSLAVDAAEELLAKRNERNGK
jgi:hypothetical protein